MTHETCPECGTAKHLLLACPACGYTHRLSGGASQAEEVWVERTQVHAEPPAFASEKRTATPRITIKRRRRYDTP